MLETLAPVAGVFFVLSRTKNCVHFLEDTLQHCYLLAKGNVPGASD